VTFASFSLLSNLASNARWDRTVYVISITIMCTLASVTTGYLVFDDTASEDSKGLGFEEWTPLALANVVLIFSGAIGIFFVMNIGREYIGLHSEAQVNMHMQQSVKVIMAVIGPIIFLFSETMGCVLTDRGFKRSCERLVGEQRASAPNARSERALNERNKRTEIGATSAASERALRASERYERATASDRVGFHALTSRVFCARFAHAASNFVTVLQFSLSAIFFLGTEISNQHLTRQDKIAMRGVDVGVTCR
jgi:hypothetical protein